MDKSIIKKEIALLINEIHMQFSDLEKTENDDAEHIKSLTATIEQLHKKAVVLEFLITHPTAPAEIKKEEPKLPIFPVEAIEQNDPTPPSIVEVIVKEEIVIHEIPAAPPVIAETVIKEETVVPPVKPSKTKDLKAFIGLNDKFEFINELFKGNPADYEAGIVLLNASENQQSAMNTFYELQKKYNWQDDNETVIHFLEILKNN